MDSPDFAQLFSDAIAPFKDRSNDVLLRVAEAVGYYGYTLEEAAEQYDVELPALRATLAFHKHFQALVDKYGAVRAREQAGQMQRHLADRIDGCKDGPMPELTAGEARMQRAVQSTLKDVKAGEREAERRSDRRAAQAPSLKGRAVVSELTIVGDQPPPALEGVRPSPDEDLEV